jgi:hypothetical protein
VAKQYAQLIETSFPCLKVSDIIHKHESGTLSLSDGTRLQSSIDSLTKDHVYNSLKFIEQTQD